MCIFRVSEAGKMVRCIRTFLGSLLGVASVAMLGPQGAVWAQSFAACYLSLGKLFLSLPSLLSSRGGGWGCWVQLLVEESFSSVIRGEGQCCWLVCFSPLAHASAEWWWLSCWLCSLAPFFLFLNLFFLANLKSATGSLLLRSFTVSKYCCWWGVIINLRYTYLVPSSMVTVSRVAEMPSLCLCGL